MEVSMALSCVGLNLMNDLKASLVVMSFVWSWSLPTLARRSASSLPSKPQCAGIQVSVMLSLICVFPKRFLISLMWGFLLVAVFYCRAVTRDMLSVKIWMLRGEMLLLSLIQERAVLKATHSCLLYTSPSPRD